jgi:hypothetical protein
MAGVNFPDDASLVHLFFYDSIPSPVTAFEIDGDSTRFKTTVPEGAETGTLSIRVGPLFIDSDSTFTVNPE